MYRTNVRVVKSTDGTFVKIYNNNKNKLNIRRLKNDQYNTIAKKKK